MIARRVVFALVFGLTLLGASRVCAADIAVVSSAEQDCTAPETTSIRGERAAESQQRECVRGIDETVTRLSAELEAAGFHVTTLSRPTSVEAGADLSPAQVGLDPLPVGVFSVTALEGTPAIEVLLTDRRSGEVLRFTLRAPDGASNRTPALLAVRAMELVRANALVLDIAPHPTPEPVAETKPPQVVLAPAPVAPPPPRFIGSLGAAAALLYGFENLGPEVAPVVTAAVMGRHDLGVRVMGAGPSFGPKLRGRDGDAKVSQALVTLGVDYRLKMRARSSVVFGLGAGAHHLRVRGQARAPFVETTQGIWSALGLAGVGGRVHLMGAMFLTLDVFAFAAFPRPVVHVADQTVGSVSRPSTLTALGLSVEL